MTDATPQTILATLVYAALLVGVLWAGRPDRAR